MRIVFYAEVLWATRFNWLRECMNNEQHLLHGFVWSISNQRLAIKNE